MPHVHRPRRRRTLVAVAIALAVGGFAAAQAQAASYYTIVNTQSGRALEASADGKVRLAAPDKTNPLQQWKQIHRESFGSWYEVALQNRLTGCLRSDAPLNPVPIASDLKTGICAGASTDSRKRWSHLFGSNTATPAIPGAQLVNSQTAEYVAHFDLCFDPAVCPAKPVAALLSASLVASVPDELGGAAKWQYKFATTAP
jgi:hypothetical protein